MTYLKKFFKTGDFVVIQGNILRSWIVRFLISVRYGIKFKAAYSHVCAFLDDMNVVSSEGEGTIIMDAQECFKKCYVKVYRFNHIDRDLFTEKIKNVIHKPYSYARYIMDLIAIVSFCMLMLTLVMLPFSFITAFKIPFIVIFSIGLFLYPLRRFFIRADKKSLDCSEAMAILYKETGLYVTMDDVRNESPNEMAHIIENLAHHGVVKEIARLDKYGWRYFL